MNSRGHKTSGGPPAWGLGAVVTIPPRKKSRCYGTFYTIEALTVLIWLRIMRQRAFGVHGGIILTN
jgi:hypothetical protein